MTEAMDDAPNVLMIHVILLLTFIATGNYDNGVSSMILWFCLLNELIMIKGVHYYCNQLTL